MRASLSQFLNFTFLFTQGFVGSGKTNISLFVCLCLYIKHIPNSNLLKFHIILHTISYFNVVKRSRAGSVIITNKYIGSV